MAVSDVVRPDAAPSLAVRGATDLAGGWVNDIDHAAHESTNISTHGVAGTLAQEVPTDLPAANPVGETKRRFCRAVDGRGHEARMGRPIEAASLHKGQRSDGSNRRATKPRARADAAWGSSVLPHHKDCLARSGERVVVRCTRRDTAVARGVPEVQLNRVPNTDCVAMWEGVRYSAG